MPKHLLVLLGILSTVFLNAQTMSVGPELGMNLIQIEKQEIGNNYQPGWYGGLMYDYKINDYLSIRSGIYYSQGRHGYSSADTNIVSFLEDIVDSSMMVPGLDLNTYTTVEGRQSLHYVQIPLQANFSWKKIQLSLGGYVGFLVGANQKEKTTEETPFLTTVDLESIDPTGFLSLFLPPAYQETTSNTSDTDGLRTFDYGLKGSLGYEIDQFGVRASYSFGLPSYRSSDNNPVIRNKYFQFSIYYLFPITGNSGSSSIR